MSHDATSSPHDEPWNADHGLDHDTDYGSDFSTDEEEIVTRLLLGVSPTIVEEDNPITTEIERNDAHQTLRLPRVYVVENRSPLFQAARAAEQVAEQLSHVVQGEPYPDLSSHISEPTRAREQKISPETAPEDTNTRDTRSPIQRFRTQPKKALSVTDLVSPAWCELQYWYTLTKHGRKRRTPAMEQGSAVHKVLEDQVHTTVKVDVETKEDAWGLRIWNVIQGLKTLRNTGLTRELEIWGTVDGLVVNGVIDELSYVCPDSELEQPTSGKEAPPDQMIISEFFKADGSSNKEITTPKRRSQTDKVYLCDVKTRGVRSLPSAAALRPTKIQLMLYHRLLASLATNTVDFSILTSRYTLDASMTFSDSFLAQVGSLNEESAPDQSQESDQYPSSQDSMTVLLAHNNLAGLWSLMITEFQLTLPGGAASLGSVLKAEYRSREDGEVVGSKTFLMDEQHLTTYVEREMQWWKGEREPVGVVVEEAFKCRSCDFADECEWRLKKVEEVKEKVRLRQRRNSSV